MPVRTTKRIATYLPFIYLEWCALFKQMVFCDAAVDGIGNRCWGVYESWLRHLCTLRLSKIILIIFRFVWIRGVSEQMVLVYVFRILQYD